MKIVTCKAGQTIEIDQETCITLINVTDEVVAFTVGSVGNNASPTGLDNAPQLSTSRTKRRETEGNF